MTKTVSHSVERGTDFLFAYELWIVPTKEEAFQAINITKNAGWNSLTFDTEEIDQPVDCAGESLVETIQAGYEILDTTNLSLADTADVVLRILEEPRGSG